MFKFKLGNAVKDSISGTTGIVDAVVEWDNGSIQYSIQHPIPKDGERVKSFWFDSHYLETDPLGRGVGPVEINPEWAFGFDDCVAVVENPYKGVITGRAMWINGCYKYYTRSVELHDGSPIHEWFDAISLRPFSKVTEAEPTCARRRRTGGPSSPSGFHS